MSYPNPYPGFNHIIPPDADAYHNTQLRMQKDEQRRKADAEADEMWNASNLAFAAKRAASLAQFGQGFQGGRRKSKRSLKNQRKSNRRVYNSRRK